MNSSNITELLQNLLDAAGRGDLPPPQPPLNVGFGGGKSPDMEPRIAKLEADMEHVKKSIDRLIDVPTKLAVLEERVTHLPTKAWMATTLGVGLGLIAALVAFSEKIHAWLS